MCKAAVLPRNGSASAKLGILMLWSLPLPLIYAAYCVCCDIGDTTELVSITFISGILFIAQYFFIHAAFAWVEKDLSGYHNRDTYAEAAVAGSLNVTVISLILLGFEFCLALPKFSPDGTRRTTYAPIWVCGIHALFSVGSVFQFSGFQWEVMSMVQGGRGLAEGLVPAWSKTISQVEAWRPALGASLQEFAGDVLSLRLEQAKSSLRKVSSAFGGATGKQVIVLVATAFSVFSVTLNLLSGALSSTSGDPVLQISPNGAAVASLVISALVVLMCVSTLLNYTETGCRVLPHDDKMHLATAMKAMMIVLKMLINLGMHKAEKTGWAYWLLVASTVVSFVVSGGTTLAPAMNSPNFHAMMEKKVVNPKVFTACYILTWISTHIGISCSLFAVTSYPAGMSGFKIGGASTILWSTVTLAAFVVLVLINKEMAHIIEDPETQRTAARTTKGFRVLYAFFVLLLLIVTAVYVTFVFLGSTSLPGWASIVNIRCLTIASFLLTVARLCVWTGLDKECGAMPCVRLWTACA